MNEMLLSLPPTWVIAIALVLALAVAWLFATIVRLVLRGRAKLGTATSIVISILASAAGLVVAGAIDRDVHLLSWLLIGLTLGFSIAGIAGYAAIAAHFQKQPRVPLAELLAGGESNRVEFKSTARVNLRTGAKDERMEQVILKTVCGFLNADGGTLVIGVDDGGIPLGLDADLATLKAPVIDRYELWLRELMTTTLGTNSAALAAMEFPEIADLDGVLRQVCVVRCRPSPRPVYLQNGKVAPAEFWRRAGNSTRQLAVNEATEYIMHRWPLSLGATVAAQLLAAVRFSERG